jgi:hypothetical protein
MPSLHCGTARTQTTGQWSVVCVRAVPQCRHCTVAQPVHRRLGSGQPSVYVLCHSAVTALWHSTYTDDWAVVSRLGTCCATMPSLHCGTARTQTTGQGSASCPRLSFSTRLRGPQGRSGHLYTYSLHTAEVAPTCMQLAMNTSHNSAVDARQTCEIAGASVCTKCMTAWPPGLAITLLDTATYYGTFSVHELYDRLATRSGDYTAGHGHLFWQFQCARHV